jgi:hypothetical protein
VPALLTAFTKQSIIRTSVRYALFTEWVMRVSDRRTYPHDIEFSKLLQQVAAEGDTDAYYPLG